MDLFIKSYERALWAAKAHELATYGASWALVGASLLLVSIIGLTALAIAASLALLAAAAVLSIRTSCKIAACKAAGGGQDDAS